MRKLLVLMAAGAFLVAFTVPAIAADWEFNGRVAFRTFMADNSKEVPGYYGGAGGPEDDSDLYWGRYVDNWIGATVTAGDITGRFMYRPLEAQVQGAGGDFAQLSASYDFGTWSFLIGKDLGPVNYFPSGQVYLDDMGLVGFGGIFTYFKPLVQATFGNFKIALAEPETPGNVVMPWGVPGMQNSNSGGISDETGAAIAPDDYDTSLPKIEASYSFVVGPASLSVMAGYQSFDAVVYAPSKEYGVDSYIFGVGFKIPFGALYVNGDIFMGQNLGQYQTTFQIGQDDAVYDSAADEIKDTETMGYCLVVGYKLSDMYSLEIGYGYLEHEADMTGTWEDDNTAWYVQLPINVAEGVQITPEVGMIDYGDVQWFGAAAKTEEGDSTYYGARWQICF